MLYYLFSLPESFYDLIEEANRVMKEYLAEQKARIALNNHFAQIKYAKQYPVKDTPRYAAVHIYYPIRASKCNKCTVEQRCIRTREKKYGKKLG